MRNATKLTIMKTTRLIFMQRIGHFVLFIRYVAKRDPGIVERRTSRNTNPDIVPVNPNSFKNVTATVVKEFTALVGES